MTPTQPEPWPIALCHQDLRRETQAQDIPSVDSSCPPIFGGWSLLGRGREDPRGRAQEESLGSHSRALGWGRGQGSKRGVGAGVGEGGGGEESRVLSP